MKDRITCGVWISSPIRLADGRRFRALTVVDVYTGECPAIELGENDVDQDPLEKARRLAK